MGGNNHNIGVQLVPLILMGIFPNSVYGVSGSAPSYSGYLKNSAPITSNIPIISSVMKSLSEAACLFSSTMCSCFTQQPAVVLSCGTVSMSVVGVYDRCCLRRLYRLRFRIAGGERNFVATGEVIGTRRLLVCMLRESVARLLPVRRTSVGEMGKID